MSVADPTLALASYLALELPATPNGKLKEGIAIYRPELPAEREEEMPRACVIVLPDPSGGAGRLFGKSDLPIWDSRLSLYCYGSTRLEAQNLGRSVEAVLRTLKAGVWEKVKLYWARHEGGAWGEKATEDPNTLWPISVVFCQVAHDFEAR
jgi:hypothetical protein